MRVVNAVVFKSALALGSIFAVHASAQDGREGPIEIKKCQVISQSGSYVLANNLTGQSPVNNNCLFITASFVTIDLAGFTISANGSAIASSELGQQLEGIAVRNGTMVGGFGGLALFGTGSIVEGVRVGPGAGHGIIVADGIVKGNIVVGRSGGTGILATGTVMVTGNYVENNGNGIFANQGSTVIGNTALNNSTGISVQCPSNLTNNTATGSSAVNIQLSGNGCNDTNNVAP
jgi:hypothetical protein